jgi:hypothetical protein
MQSTPPPRARYKLAPEVDLLMIEYVAGDARADAQKTLASVRL